MVNVSVVGELKKENETLKVKCNEYEVAIQELREKVEGDSVGRDAAVSEAKLEKLRNAWIKENEAEKASFREERL